jgi:hypothetical protein
VAHDITEHNKPFSDSEFVKLYGGRSWSSLFIEEVSIWKYEVTHKNRCMVCGKKEYWLATVVK